MAQYSEVYLDFTISINVIADIYDLAVFRCTASISSANSKTEVSMTSSERFLSESDAKAAGMHWAKTWIDQRTHP